MYDKLLYNLLLNSEDSDIENAKVRCKRKNRRKITDSDSDALLVNSDSSFVLEDSLSSDSSTKQHKITRKRKTRKSSDTDTSFSEKRYTK